MSNPSPEKSERRVVLVKPGDLLILGNVGPLDLADAEALGAFGTSLKESWGIRFAVFEQDIDLDAVPGGSGG